MKAFLPMVLAAASILAGAVTPANAQDGAARDFFGAKDLPARMESAAIGFYSEGCLAGGVALPADGPTWQAMRLSRNRRWGHPDLVALVERLSREAAAQDGWPGLLVGDLSQPRGGPMTSGHASHQVGLDADIWLTPMPDRRLSYKERENISARSVLKEGTLNVDPAIWTKAHARLIMRAASYNRVERIFVHPGIKKQLCEHWQGDRSALGKVRPYWGHHYHFHIRMKCPPGSPGCEAQNPPPRGTDCDESLAWWFTEEPWADPSDPPQPEAPEPQPTQLSELPRACMAVLNAPPPVSEAAATMQPGAPAPVYAVAEEIPVPTPRPR
jgi:penicillin-insensitive murein endopeptidase